MIVKPKSTSHFWGGTSCHTCLFLLYKQWMHHCTYSYSFCFLFQCPRLDSFDLDSPLSSTKLATDVGSAFNNQADFVLKFSGIEGKYDSNTILLCYISIHRSCRAVSMLARDSSCLYFRLLIKVLVYCILHFGKMNSHCVLLIY